MEISTRPHRRETSRRYLRPTKDIPKSNPSKLPIPYSILRHQLKLF